jgi:hypothetical protein
LFFFRFFLHINTSTVKCLTPHLVIILIQETEQFRDFEEWFDYEHQRIEQKRLLQQEIIKSKLKKVLKEGVPFTSDIREIFPEYY